MKMEYREDPDLMPILLHAGAEELAVLVDVITDGGQGRLALDSDQSAALWAARKAKSFSPEALATIAGTIQGFGGNSVANILRGGKGVVYREILCDVADHFKVNHDTKQDTVTIEAALLMKTLEQSMNGMGEEDRRRVFQEFSVPYQGVGPAAMAALFAAIRTSGPQLYRLAALVAPTAIRFLTGRAVPYVVAGPMMRGIGVLAGPIGIALTGIWTVYDLASPAYRVTVPCVLQIAYLRQKGLMRACPACQNLQSTSARFCSECGNQLEIA